MQNNNFTLLGPYDPGEIFDTIWDQTESCVLLPSEPLEMEPDPEIEMIFG